MSGNFRACFSCKQTIFAGWILCLHPGRVGVSPFYECFRVSNVILIVFNALINGFGCSVFNNSGDLVCLRSNEINARRSLCFGY